MRARMRAGGCSRHRPFGRARGPKRRGYPGCLTLGARWKRLAGALAVALAVLAFGGGALASEAGRAPVNSELPWHEAQVDRSGGLVPWYQPRRDLGYDRVLRLG